MKRKTGFVFEVSAYGPHDGITHREKKARGNKGLSTGLERRISLLNIFGLKYPGGI